MNGLAIGQKASATRIFTAEDIADYRVLTGDLGLGFGEIVVETAVPGPLLAGMFSDLLGTKLPGRGTNWLKQQLQFSGGANVGEAVTAVVQITRLRPEKHLVNLHSTCATAAGDIVCSGETLVMVSDLETETEQPEKSIRR
jgi:3-hydroxybutyryl-CoA dehydratase